MCSEQINVVTLSNKTAPILVYSSLDCSFLVVDLGFVPRHYTSDEVSVGLWSFEGSDGHCVSHCKFFVL